jgi:uncharacterized protein (TIGR03435 family)
MRRAAIAAALIACAIAGAAGQQTAVAVDDAQGTLAFEVVSIKESGTLGGGGSIGMLPNGRWRATNVPVVSVISSAWQVPQNRIYGVPDWASATRYEINAVAATTATRAQQAPMVQAMLRDRFKLAVHKETRDLPIYNLVVGRADGRLGPSLRLARVEDCFDREAIAKLNPPPPPCRTTFGTGTLTGTMTLDNLAIWLTGASGRPVFNRTGLAGFYEVDLAWTAGLGPDSDGSTASIFTAVQEQLGLKLESATAPLDVLIVDHVERPTAN